MLEGLEEDNGEGLANGCQSFVSAWSINPCAVPAIESRAGQTESPFVDVFVGRKLLLDRSVSRH